MTPTNHRPQLNSQRPLVNRKFLTEAQNRQRNQELAEEAAYNLAKGTTASAGTSLAKSIVQGNTDTDSREAIQDATLHGAIYALGVGAYKLAKDGIHTLSGNSSENVGQYAPDLSDPNVRQAIFDTIRTEIENSNFEILDERQIVTPTLKQLGLVFTF